MNLITLALHQGYIYNGQFGGEKLMWTERRSGIPHQRSQFDHRSPYERDQTRVIHNPAFRRLQRKTQILGTEEGDFHRTRLTHSLEVASIGVSLVRNLKHHQEDAEFIKNLPTDDLITVICLLHDIGHPPFGHGGEVALNYAMRDHGGFEGNGQTLRLLTKTESSYGPFGLDLTRRSLLGILKYPVMWDQVIATARPQPKPGFQKTIRVNDWLPPKGFFKSEESEVEWLLSPFNQNERILFQSLKEMPTPHAHGKAAFHTLDCSIMNIADDVAYGVHDLEDAIHLKLITKDQFETLELHEILAETELSQPDMLIQHLFHSDLHLRKEAIGELVNYFITSLFITVSHEEFITPLFRYKAVLKPEAERLINWLVACVYRHVIDSQAARTFEFGGQTIILHLFEALSSNPSSLLDSKYRQLYDCAENEEAGYRILCDYIANMTDEYAYRMHERLFGLSSRAIFES